MHAKVVRRLEISAALALLALLGCSTPAVSPGEARETASGAPAVEEAAEFPPDLDAVLAAEAQAAAVALANEEAALTEAEESVVQTRAGVPVRTLSASSVQTAPSAKLAAAQADVLELLTRSTKTGQVRSIHLDGRQFVYEEIDGLAILEGDIVLGDAAALQALSTGVTTRGVAIDPSAANVYGTRWPQGIVPYTIQNGFSATMQTRIQNAIAHWNTNTVMTLRPKISADTDYVRFTVKPGVCHSRVGRVGNGRQDIGLDNGACGTGAVIHEIGHSAGLFHEQSRCDRDQFVRILIENVQTNPDRRHNFNRQCSGATDIGAYNFSSVMHYSRFAFSRNEQPTIEARQTGVQVGGGSVLNAGDIAAVAAMYPEGAPRTPGISYVASQLSSPIGDGITNGNYYIRNERGQKFLDVSGSCHGKDRCKTQLWDIGASTSNNIFNIYKSEGLGYRIKNGSHFLEVDFWRNGENGLTPWMFSYAPVPQQDWIFYRVGPNRYVIKNVLSGKVLDAVNSCVMENGCKVQQWSMVTNDMSQVWILERVN